MKHGDLRHHDLTCEYCGRHNGIDLYDVEEPQEDDGTGRVYFSDATRWLCPTCAEVYDAYNRRIQTFSARQAAPRSY